MSVITPEGTLVIENSHLDVRGNVNAVALKLGTARLTPSYDLAAVTGVGNTTPYTVEFSNATTGLATTSNLHVGGTLKIGTVEFENPLSLAAVSLVSNTTPYTIEFSNAATGIATTANVDVGGELAVTGNATVSSNLTVSGNATVSSNLTVSGNATVGEELTVTGNATMTSNLTVTGDLNVSGALGILNAIYPVGTLIDRATAITDTHLNGKYKAFLAAPDQEWQLVDNGHNKVLEDLSSPCNTTSLFGRATMDSVTAVQTLSLTAQDVTGSVVSGYTPVTGTDRVRYSFDFLAADDGTADPIWTHSIFFRINGGSWIEVVSSRNQGHTMRVSKYPVSWTFVLGASTADHDDGVLTETNPTLDFKIVAEEYGSTYQVKLHETKHWQQSGADQFSMPTISITAIGTKSLEYKRTA